jgi:hypothetical protein
MKPVNKGFFLGGYIGGIVGAACMLFAAAVASGILDSHDETFVLVAVGFAVPALLLSLVVYYTLVYKMWAVIQNGSPPPRTTPGMAVGLSLIPVFNFYWKFVAIHGWAKDYNAYVRRRRLVAPQMPEGLALAMCIVPLIGCIVGASALLVNAILTAVFINKACDGINALIAAETYRHYDDEEPSYVPQAATPADPDDTRFSQRPLGP